MSEVKGRREQDRERRRSLYSDVLNVLKRSARVISVVPDPTESRRLIGQLTDGGFFAVHVRLPGEATTEEALTYLQRAAANGALAFVAGAPSEVERWLLARL